MSVNIGIPTEDQDLSDGKKYDARHEVWDTAHQLGSPIYRLRQSLIIKLLPGREKSLHFLDAGCGTGDYACVLLERGHRVDAIDISESAVREAVNRIPESLRSRFHAQVGDFFLLGQEACYDGIICSEVLEHVQDDETLLRQLHALLSPQGSLILSVPADPALWSNDDVFSGHVRRYTRDDLITKLERAGFRIASLWSYGFPILRIYSWMKIRLLGGNSIEVVGRHGGATGRRFALRLVAAIVNALVWLVDRHFLHTNRGIGYVVQCRKA